MHTEKRYFQQIHRPESKQIKAALFLISYEHVSKIPQADIKVKLFFLKLLSNLLKMI